MERAREEPRPDDPPPAEAAEAAAPPAQASPADGARCPYCHVAIPWGETAAACDACTAPHHAQCFGEHQGCAASGCQGQTARAVTLRPRVDPRPKCAVCAGVLDPESWVTQCGCGWCAHVDCDAALRCPRALCGQPTRLGTLGFLRASARASGLRTIVVLLGVLAAAALLLAAAGGGGLWALDTWGAPGLSSRERDDLFGVCLAALVLGGAGGLFSLVCAFACRGQLARAEDEQRRHSTRKPRPPAAKGDPPAPRLDPGPPAPGPADPNG